MKYQIVSVRMEGRIKYPPGMTRPLAELINRECARGWVPLGGVSVVWESPHWIGFQAMTREIEGKVEKEETSQDGAL